MEKALIIAVNNGINSTEFDEEILELKSLCEACAIETVKIVAQNLNSFHPETYLGKGKIQEVKEMLDDELIVVANDELTPLQISNLEEELQTAVYDRTYIILEIFKRRAQTKEAQLQVELATQKYLLPRLVGAHRGLSRQRGTGGGFARGRGSGEMKLELERRNIRDSIAKIKKELSALTSLRQQQRSRRKKMDMKIVSLVGYTNSGKSSTLNALLNYSTSLKKDVLEKDMLFATLETATRFLKTPRNVQFLLTDTVGFVEKLPHHLVEAFKSTLEEITESDLILHIVDSSNPHYSKQIEVTNQVLKEIGVKNIPIIHVFNKIDLHEDSFFIPPAYEPAISISAKESYNLDKLLSMIEDFLFKTYHQVKLELPFSETLLLNQIKENGIIDNLQVNEDHYFVEAKISDYIYSLVRNYIR